VKNKDKVSSKNQKDWLEFIKNPGKLHDKDFKEVEKNTRQRFIFDLHGYTLEQANIKVKEIILDCFEKNFKEILLITGKGIHSDKDDNVYSSTDLGKLKYSVPDYIKNNQELLSVIRSIRTAGEKYGGQGALLIRLKKL
tara:strand:+ start:191 stop:607 length:417 start_codon:yes stop_codon:yes gene_type:complete